MAYERTNWQNGDVISSEKLNKMEAGIEYACSLEHEVEDPTEGQVLKYDAEKGKFVNEDAAIETNIQNPTDGQTLKYDAATGKWVNGEGGGSAAPLMIHIVVESETAEAIVYRMDKTAAEIKAAFPNVVLDKEDTLSSTAVHRLTSLPEIIVPDELEGVFISLTSDVDYFTDSDNGYPTTHIDK